MHYLKSFLSYARGKIILSLGLKIFVGMSEGIGLFMLIPFMQLIGIGGQAGKPDSVTAAARTMMALLGVAPTLTGLLCLYIALIAAQAFVNRISQIMNTELVSGYTCFLQSRMYSVLAYADWLSFTRLRASDIVHVLALDVRRVGMITQQLLQLVGEVILCVVYIAVAMAISIPLTLAALACGALLILMLRPFDRQAGTTGKAVQLRFQNQLAEITEHLAGMKLARSYGMEHPHIRHFESITAQIAERQINFARSNANAQMYYKIGSAIALSGFFYGAVGLARVDSAQLLLMVFLFARLLPRFSRIQLNLQQINFNLPAFTSASRMHAHFLAIRQPKASKPSRSVELQHAIRFDRVSFSYDPKAENFALRHICLTIPAGRMTAIVGPSGAGKSTLADLLLGLLTPTSGSITIDGLPLAGAMLGGWRRLVGYVPQETFLFNDTIRANLLWACPRASEAEIWTALREASASEFVAALPQGLDTLLGDRGVRLSGGERQRIALARALLRKPALLLLDEATSSLDTINEKRIQKAIAHLHGQLTIVVIAHRLSTIREADHIVVLEAGRVIEQGDWGQLAATERGHFHAMLHT